MQKKLLDFADSLGLTLQEKQLEQLLAFAWCVWGKKDFLNLTSAHSFDEVITRHICDGLVAAHQLGQAGYTHANIADVGAGCGYIGFTLAVALPQARLTLVESLEKRCKFMNWAALQTNISNIQVKQARLGQGTHFGFDCVTERAMGTLPDIINICLDAVHEGGLFVAFQGENPQTAQAKPLQGHFLKDVAYSLPCDNKTRHLVLFRKNDA